MNIDELQERFNEMRRKKWRTVGSNTPVEVVGFIKNFNGHCQIIVQIYFDPVFIDAETLRTVRGTRPLIEEVSPYADWPIDAKAYFWDWDRKLGARGYFAGIHHDGRPMSWINGSTSWSSDGNSCDKIAWNHAELAEGGK